MGSASVLIRPAEEADLPAVLAIYNDAVLNSTATFDLEPRTMEAQSQWFRETAHPYAVLVAAHDGDVLAWGCLRPFQHKPAYRFTAEDSVYVRPNRQGKGVGKLLLGALLETAKANGFRNIIARIVADNPASVRLHELFGFQQVGVERQVGYKFERWLDVVVMQKTLHEGAT